MTAQRRWDREEDATHYIVIRQKEELIEWLRQELEELEQQEREDPSDAVSKRARIPLQHPWQEDAKQFLHRQHTGWNGLSGERGIIARHMAYITTGIAKKEERVRFADGIVGFGEMKKQCARG